MLNYIWAGLIILSLVFALATDFGDLLKDRYRNGQELSVSLSYPNGYDAEQRKQDVTLSIERDKYQSLYGVDPGKDLSFEGSLYKMAAGSELRFARDAELPEPLSIIRDVTGKRNNELLANVDASQLGVAGVSNQIVFRKVRFVKLNAISQSAIDFAETAVTIALSLIGVLALWLGLLRIAEKSGLIDSLVKLVQPVLRPLFPGIPKNHPAMGMVALNMTANMLGLGNAATPLGIKAMEELQNLSKEKEVATNDMVTLLALNTGSVQLVPPALLVAVMGLQINQLIFAIILATLLSTAAGVFAAKMLQRLPRYKKTEPQLID